MKTFLKVDGNKIFDFAKDIARRNIESSRPLLIGKDIQITALNKI